MPAQFWTPVGPGSQQLYDLLRPLYGQTTRAGLQAAIDGDAELGLPAIVGGGAELICDVGLDIDGGPNAGGTGGMMLGGGASQMDAFGSTTQRNASRVTYGGTRVALEHLIKLERTYYTIANMALAGMTRAQLDGGATVKAPRGIFINRSAVPGVGTGALTFQGLSFDGFDTAVEVANELGDSNCDTSTFIGCSWNGCNRAFRSNSEQTLGFMFLAPLVGNTGIGADLGIFWDIYAGGRFTSYGGTMASPTTFMQFRNANDLWGQNASQYEVRGLGLDNGGNGLARMVHQEPMGDGYYADILIDNCWYGSVLQTVSMYHLSGKDHLQIRGGSGLQKNAITWDTSLPGSFVKVTIEGHTISYTGDDLTLNDHFFDHANSAGPIWVECRNNSYLHAAPLTAIGKSIMGTG